MLEVNAIFERKISHFDMSSAKIDAVEELPHREFSAFSQGLLTDTDIIAAHQDNMFQDEDGVRHTLLVLDSDSQDGVLVDSQGYSYARYAAWLPGIKTYFQSQLMQIADDLIQHGTQESDGLPDHLHFEDLEKQYGIHLSDDNGIGRALCSLLFNAEETAEVEMSSKGYTISYFPDFCNQQNPEMKM